MRAGRRAEALEQFMLAAQIDPASPTAAYNLGVALDQVGQTTAAIAQFQRALQLDPQFAPAQKELDQLQSPPKN